MENQEAQKIAQVYYFLEARLSVLLKNREILINKIIEIEKTIESLKGLKKGNDFILPIGSGTFVFSEKISKEHVLVDIGSNIFVEKSLEDAIKVLGERKSRIEDMVSSLENEILDAQQKLKILAERFEKLRK